MDDKKTRSGYPLLILIASSLLILALWPPAMNLYDLTGEEELPAQMVGMMHWLHTSIRPQPNLALQESSFNESPTVMGVNTFLQQEVELEKRAKSLDLARLAGFQFIRQEFQWEDIEIHGKGDFVDRRNDPNGIDAWVKYDHIVDLAEDNDMEIVARLSNPPSWSRSLPDEEIGTLAPPDDFVDFADFAAAVATRYKNRIHLYQIWNEPNGNDEWGLQNVDPEAYTQLLCMAYDRIKAIDPEAIISAGALTPTLAMDGRNMNDLIFLQRMYNAGAGECFDVMSAQGYGLWSGATDRRLRPTVINFPHHLLLRDLMVRHGDGHKPIWISEMGWNVVPEGIEARFGRVTEEQQARYTIEGYQKIIEEWPWVEIANYWFLKRPADWEKEQSWYYFRLLEPNFETLPVYEALVEFQPDQYAPNPDFRWVTLWNNSRSALFFLGASTLFFILLRFLSPKDRDYDS